MSMLPADIHRVLEKAIPAGPRYMGQEVKRIDTVHDVREFRMRFAAHLADGTVHEIEQIEYVRLQPYFPQSRHIGHSVLGARTAKDWDRW